MIILSGCRPHTFYTGGTWQSQHTRSLRLRHSGPKNPMAHPRAIVPTDAASHNDRMPAVNGSARGLRAVLFLSSHKAGYTLSRDLAHSLAPFVPMSRYCALGREGRPLSEPPSTNSNGTAAAAAAAAAAVQDPLRLDFDRFCGKTTPSVAVRHFCAAPSPQRNPGHSTATPLLVVVERDIFDTIVSGAVYHVCDREKFLLQLRCHGHICFLFGQCD